MPHVEYTMRGISSAATAQSARYTNRATTLRQETPQSPTETKLPPADVIEGTVLRFRGWKVEVRRLGLNAVVPVLRLRRMRRVQRRNGYFCISGSAGGGGRRRRDC